MRKITISSFLLLIVLLASCKSDHKNSFWSDGVALFDIQEVFRDERFPNVVVAKDGSIVCSWGSENIESASQVVVALTGLGIDPHRDERFVKDGNSVIDNLMNFALEDGGFSKILNGKVNVYRKVYNL